MPHSTQSKSVRKPPKPYKDFPLFPHATKRWAKKIRGKMYYFGPWADPDGALKRFKEQRERLYSDTPQPTSTDNVTVRFLVNAFLTAKKNRVDSGELAQRSWNDYHTTCGHIIKFFGPTLTVAEIGPKDFDMFRSKLARKWGPTTLGNEIRRVRAVFNFAFKHDLIDRPVKFGEFTPPGRKTMQLERAKRGKRMFEAKELQSILDRADCIMRTMILLGINTGVGNMDVALLTLDKLDLKKGWLDYPRGKTGIARRCPLWPETVDALKVAIGKRPQPRSPEYANHVFLTQKLGGPWAKTETRDNALSAEFRKLLDKIGIRQKGLSFYGLRHTFETIAGDSRDQVAVDAIMGHADDSMAATYRERISDDRLLAVVHHVHTWLFGEKK